MPLLLLSLACSQPGLLLAVDAGLNSHSCDLDGRGEVVCWGLRHDEAADGPFGSLSAGQAYTCGLRAGGEALCWGSAEELLGTPPEVPFLQIDAGYKFSCGVLSRTSSGAG